MLAGGPARKYALDSKDPSIIEAVVARLTRKEAAS